MGNYFVGSTCYKISFGGIIMIKKSVTGQKWWKIGAAAFLSVGLLGACGDGEDDPILDEEIEEEMEEEEEETD